MQEINKTPYKAVLIDLDNTLANTEDYYESAVMPVYEFLKPKLKIVTWPQFKSAYQKARALVHSNLANTAASHSRAMYFQYTLELLGAEYNAHIIYKARQLYWDYVMQHAKLYPGAREFLKKLNNANIKIVLITDNELDIQLKKLVDLKIDKYIDAVVTSEEAGADKPAINQFLLGMHKVNSTIYNTLVIGNNPKTDIKGATNANLPACLFDFNKKYLALKEQVTCYANNYKQIQDFLNLNKPVKISKQKALVIDLMGIIFTPGHIIKKVLFPLLKKQSNISYKKVRHNYEKLSLGFLTTKEFWKNLGINNAQRIQQEFLSTWQINSEFIQFLNNFLAKNKNIKTVLFSNIPHEWGKYQIQKHKLNRLFDHIIFNDSVHARKPNPAVYQALLQKLPNIWPKNIIYIDDKLACLRTAKLFNITTLWYNQDPETTETIVHIPDFYAKSVKQLINVLKGVV